MYSHTNWGPWESLTQENINMYQVIYYLSHQRTSKRKHTNYHLIKEELSWRPVCMSVTNLIMKTTVLFINWKKTMSSRESWWGKGEKQISLGSDYKLLYHSGHVGHMRSHLFARTHQKMGHWNRATCLRCVDVEQKSQRLPILRRLSTPVSAILTCLIIYKQWVPFWLCSSIYVCFRFSVVREDEETR